MENTCETYSYSGPKYCNNISGNITEVENMSDFKNNISRLFACDKNNSAQFIFVAIYPKSLNIHLTQASSYYDGMTNYFLDNVSA